MTNTEYPMPQTFDDAVFWLEISGYKILDKQDKVKIQAPNGDIFHTAYSRVIEAGRRCWRQFYNISEVKAYKP